MGLRFLDVLRPVRAWRLFRVALWRLGRWRREIELTLARRFGLTTREDRIFFILIPLIGVFAGVFGIAIHGLINGTRRLLWGDLDLVVAGTGAPWWVGIGVPLLGGMAVGLIVWLGKQKVSGQGMSVLIESVALHGGKVRGTPVTLRALAAVATVGCGGSLGREGPMIRLGAMLASKLASRFALPRHRVKILLGCGAAAGLAAAYNIPVGGTLFAMEVILGNFALDIFGPIVVSSVIATVIVRAAEGNTPSYAATGLEVAGGWEILGFAALGVLGALVAVLFILGVRRGSRAIDRIGWLPQPLRPILGMTLLGVLAWLTGLPHILGSGTDAARRAIADELTIRLVLVLIVAKLVATILTTACGGAGGLFTPSLSLGALVGGAFGYGLHALWPAATSSPGTYAAVGMAAVAAGTSHAPISAILILFEFTKNYDIILPLMLAAIISSLLARWIYPHSIYTEALDRRGVDVSLRMEEAVLAGLKVKDLARADEDVLLPTDDYRKVVERFLLHHRQRLFVVTEDHRLRGAVSLHTIKHALDDPASLVAVLAHDLMTPVELVLSPGVGLHHAAEVFARTDFERIPVIDEAQTYRGVLAKRDLLAVYSQEVLGRPATLATFVNETEAARDYVELPPEFSVRLVPVPPQLVGKCLAEVRLPQALGATVLQIRRMTLGGEKRVFPEATTLLSSEDSLILLGPTVTLAAIERGDLELDLWPRDEEG